MRWTPGRARLAALVIPIVLFAIKFRYVGSGDTVPAELLPIEILVRGSLTFPQRPGAALPYWFHQTPHGVVSSYPILPGLLNVPAFVVARLAGADLYERRIFLSHVTAALCAVLSVLFVYLVLERLLPTPTRALCFALVYAFGTEVWSMASRGLFQHGPALMFLSGGLYALLRRTLRADLAAGALLCLAILTRSTAVLLVVPVVVWAAIPAPRRLLGLAAGAAPPALLHAAYAYRYWGSPFSLAQPVGTEGFNGDALQGLAGLLVSPSRGLLVFSPVFLFAIPAAIRAFRPTGDPRAPLMRALSVGVVLTIAVYSRWHSWWGGHSFGYRLLAELALPLTVLVAWDWERIRASSTARMLFASAVALSIVVHALGAFHYPTSFNSDVDVDQSRLWDPVDTELVLRARRTFGKRGLGTAEDRLVPWLRPTAPPSPKWWNGGDADDSILRVLDAPVEGQLVLGPLAIVGWAKPAPDDDGQVLVSLSPGDRRMTADRFARPDVPIVFPALGAAAGAEAGFGLHFQPPSRLESAAILVEVRDRQGRVARAGPVSILWGPARGPRASRRERG